jgi:hypothetical protein
MTLTAVRTAGGWGSVAVALAHRQQRATPVRPTGRRSEMMINTERQRAHAYLDQLIE